MRRRLAFRDMFALIYLKKNDQCNNKDYKQEEVDDDESRIDTEKAVV